jgi:cytochrome P450
VKVTERFERRWQRAAAAGTAIDLQADLMRYTVDVTAGLAFGADINTIESDTEVIQQHLDKVLPSLFKRLMAPFPTWRWLRNRSVDKHLKALQSAVAQFITQARARMDANPALRSQPTNLIESMIAARDTEGSGVDDADVAGNVLTMLLAGEDTTANTLAWMIYLLSRNPGGVASRAGGSGGQGSAQVREHHGAAVCGSVHQRDHAAEAGGADPDARADPRHQAGRARSAGRRAAHVPDARGRDR